MYISSNIDVMSCDYKTKIWITVQRTGDPKLPKKVLYWINTIWQKFTTLCIRQDKKHLRYISDKYKEIGSFG